MKNINIYTEFITLGQFLKLTGTIHNGGDAKDYIANNEIIVNGEKEDRRGRKLYDGYQILIDGTSYCIKSDVQSK